MTQMLLFDCPTTAAVPVMTPSRDSRDDRRASVATSTSAPANVSPASRTPLSGSVPIHDPQQGELHRIGDLAQLVLARYELLHRRRAARRRAGAAS